MKADHRLFPLSIAIACGLLLVQAPRAQAPQAGSGLLFYLSGDHGLTADYAANGKVAPNFAADVRLIGDGAKGPGFECAHTQLLSYWAAGNVYAERGTLSFFWRSREPVGKTEFPVFRVGYADHSSWDMVWLRIDYNGKPGFDAFDSVRKYDVRNWKFLAMLYDSCSLLPRDAVKPDAKQSGGI